MLGIQPMSPHVEQQRFPAGFLGKPTAAWLVACVWLSVAVEVLALWQVRAALGSNLSFWLFVVAFLLGLLDLKIALLASVFVLAIAPDLPKYGSTLLQATIVAWPYPGVDALIGVLASWVLRNNTWAAGRELANRFPSRPLVLLNLWIAASAVFSISHNLWQSAGPVSWNGFKINVRLIRGLSWNDDFYPLQDLFFYTTCLAVLFLVAFLLHQSGRRLLNALALAILLGVATNAAFAFWQEANDRLWIGDYYGETFHSLWPDVHSFAALMVVGIFLGIGAWRQRQWPRWTLALVASVVGAAVVALVLSRSRFLVFACSAAAIVLGIRLLLTASTPKRLVALVSSLSLLAFLTWTLKQGYRGLSLSGLESLLLDFDVARLNVLLAYRPEIWKAALDMYVRFPLTGIGQGSFVRLSDVAGFSTSETLLKLGGESAHNYFLQAFVELGPIGLGLALLALVPAWRLGRKNSSALSFYALLGVALGNVYGHALLVREMLALAAVLLSMYYWEAHQLAPASMAPLSSPARRTVSALFAVLLCVASVEAVASFNRFPFTYGQRCYEPRQWSDGWSSGLVRRSVEGDVKRIDAALSWPRRDLDRQPITIEAKVINPDGSVLSSQSLNADRPELRLVPLAFDLPGDGVPRTLTIKASRCYVPLNLGDTYDPRPLGFRLPLLRFSDGDGRSVPLAE